MAKCPRSVQWESDARSPSGPSQERAVLRVDSGSGRELQNKSVHNIAGLGAADGDRPFRPFARPVPFVPRSTIRIEIEELSAGPFFKDGTLFIVLHGYKRLGE